MPPREALEGAAVHFLVLHGGLGARSCAAALSARGYREVERDGEVRLLRADDPGGGARRGIIARRPSDLFESRLAQDR